MTHRRLYTIRYIKIYHPIKTYYYRVQRTGRLSRHAIINLSVRNAPPHPSPCHLALARTSIASHPPGPRAPPGEAGNKGHDGRAHAPALGRWRHTAIFVHTPFFFSSEKPSSGVEGSIHDLTLLEPQSRFGDKRVKLRVVLSPKRDCGPKRIKRYKYHVRVRLDRRKILSCTRASTYTHLASHEGSTAQHSSVNG